MKVSNVEQIHLPSQLYIDSRYCKLQTLTSPILPYLPSWINYQLITDEITLFHTTESHIVWALQAGKKQANRICPTYRQSTHSKKKPVQYT